MKIFFLLIHFFYNLQIFCWQFFVYYDSLTETYFKEIKTSSNFGGKKIGIGENEIYLILLINVKIRWEFFSNFCGLLTIFELYENIFFAYSFLL